MWVRREAIECTPDPEGRFVDHRGGMALWGISSRGGKHTDHELCPLPVLLMAALTHPSWGPAAPRCPLRNLPRASLLPEVGS